MIKYEIRFTIPTNNVFKFGVEGNYKTKLIAERHIRKLRRKYLGTEFKIKEIVLAVSPQGIL